MDSSEAQVHTLPGLLSVNTCAVLHNKRACTIAETPALVQPTNGMNIEHQKCQEFVEHT